MTIKILQVIEADTPSLGERWYVLVPTFSIKVTERKNSLEPCENCLEG